jgi:hypothetical protein
MMMLFRGIVRFGRTGLSLLTMSVCASMAMAQGGDTVEDATVIPHVPFLGIGTTEGYTNDYDEACPTEDLSAPDVVYAFTPDVDYTLELSLCWSEFDTKLYIYENEVTPGAPLACNDDFCDVEDSRRGLLASELQGVSVTAGNTYYIVVDGSNGEAGEYSLRVSAFVDEVVCPEGASFENEPVCYDGYIDEFNAGCHRLPRMFTPLACGETICAEGGTYELGGQLGPDVDWYLLEPPADAESLLISGVSEFPLLVWIWVEQGEVGDCEEFYVNQGGGDALQLFRVDGIDLTASAYYLQVLAAPGIDVPCGSAYVLSAECTFACPADLDGSGAVDVTDLLALLGAWGQSGVPADLDGSGTVDVGDLLMLLAAWGDCN